MFHRQGLMWQSVAEGQRGRPGSAWCCGVDARVKQGVFRLAALRRVLDAEATPSLPRAPVCWVFVGC